MSNTKHSFRLIPTASARSIDAANVSSISTPFTRVLAAPFTRLLAAAFIRVFATVSPRRFTAAFLRLFAAAILFLASTFASITSNAQSSANAQAASNAQSPANAQAAANTQSSPANPPANFKHATAKVNGVNIHYVIGGAGEPLVLIHGFGQNWYMWNRLLPEFSKHFTVIAPDMRGVGESDKPESGYDKKNMAKDIHELVRSLGYKSANIAGHDIGLMVAYAYAAQWPDEVKKLALMDALLPGIEPVWSQVKGSAWWFGFFAFPASAELVAGRERLFLTNFWPVVGHNTQAFTKVEIDEFIRSYAAKGGTYGAFHWFAAFEQDAKDNIELAKNKLPMPLLAMGGEYFGAAFLEAHCKLVADHVTGSNIKGSGHWVVQENTGQVQKDLLAFFTGSGQ